ncbi:YtxH domain-containing protein [Dyadobacter chenwenxiniae]|uniref:YtxH domain-containing protein n=1 Tax=Dyadobacter chenwenxiniae TaxID=2906456 RepID=A0A9X1THI7_9BACT|nr:YtxH domain-containing protein [Dyadobacter chenwenxiniae]MCF0050427.1 YtxH domain-containing protein [Dyadobacter chenwenxiniae]MCF0064539.1 YtxH domain-containing protein [Dyadobacter chenwenxiniae]UON84403.1 YtxH domain-containing protein [Dyadobacter chenwenxiniae]
MKTKYGNVDFNDDSAHNDGLITGLLLGAAIGACAAILFAPKSGKEFREKIKDVAGQQSDKLSKQWENVKSKAGDLASNAKESVESIGSDAESKFNEFADTAEDEVKEGAENAADKFQRKY